MTRLTARYALCPRIERVSAEAQAAPACPQGEHAIYAVHAPAAENAGGLETAGFLGLVCAHEIALRPGVSFRELLSGSPWPALNADAPLERVVARFEESRACALPILDHSGKFIGAVSRKSLLDTLVGQDRSLAETLLAAAGLADPHATAPDARLLQSAVEQSDEMIVIADPCGIVQYVNPAFERITGFSRGEIVGRPKNILESGLVSPEISDRIWSRLQSGHTFHDVVVTRRKDGALSHVEETITPLTDRSGRITHFIATGQNITERMQALERLDYLSNHDPLTELPNRALFLDRLAQALPRARWHERVVAVLCLDLDRFKIINDTLGHDVGDRLLQATAERLKQCVREGDTVARVGGNELAIILADVAAVEDIPRVARKILEAHSLPFAIEGRELFASASVGISLYPNDGEGAQSLLKNANIAMHRAKDHGGNNYQFYSVQMAARSAERLELENSLRRALERGEFVLHYQPQLDLATGAITGVEALVRWQHPDLGLVSPLQFIPLAEETGLIVPLGEWVLHTACAQNRAWQGQGLTPMRVSVNLSGRQFQQQNLADRVARALDETGLAPSYLDLELTESILIHETETAISTLQQLDRMGTGILIDDFGTGYSSLSYLKRFPIGTLKIDRSFVRDIATDPNDAAIVTAITTMAHSLGMKVIAEGVETQDQLEFLRDRNCDAMQGYYLSRPIPAEDMSRFLKVFGIPAGRTGLGASA